MRLTNLDMDVLRTFVEATDLGGFARAANRLGRSQSAISLQMKKLEEQVGQRLFEKQGRGTALTEMGDIVLGYARRILSLNDEAMTAARGMALEGTLRFGVPHDFAATLLPSVLTHLSCIHPQLHVRAHVDRRLVMLEQLEAGALDVVLAFGASDRLPRALVATLPIAWIGPHSGFPLAGKSVPLLLSDPPCSFRHAVIEALDRANIPWRIVFTSPNLPALWAATEAGLGITPRTAFGLPKSLTILPANSDLPMLPHVPLALHAFGDPLPPAVASFQAIVIEALAVALPAGSVSKSVNTRAPLHPPPKPPTQMPPSLKRGKRL